MIPVENPTSSLDTGDAGTSGLRRQRKQAPKQISQWRALFNEDGFCLLAIGALIIAAFWKTIFFARPISRLAYMADWDSFLDAWKTGASHHIDPSAVLLAYPAYSHIAGLLHSGQLPLWNPLNACGSPLLADIQTTVLSPLHWLFFLIPNEYTYNLQLVLHVLVAALGGYALGRALGVKPSVALLPATCFSMTPFFLWYMELQTGQVFALYPLLMALFIRTARLQTLSSAVFAGVGAGLVVLAGHPECSLFAVAGSTAYLMIHVAVDRAEGRTLWQALQTGAALTAAAGAAAFCISAPVLLPFLEFLKNSDCYKFSVSASAFVPWQAILYSQFAPGFGGASPFVGVLCVALIPLAFMRWCRASTTALASISVFCIWFCAKFFPFDFILSHPPFNYIITVYCLPLLFMCQAGLACLGLQNLVDGLMRRRAWSPVLLGISGLMTVLAVLIPFVLLSLSLPLASGNFDLTVPDMHVDRNALLISAIVILGALVSVAVCLRVRLPRICALALVLLNLLSVGSVAKSSLPSLAEFKIPPVPTFQHLRDSGDRALAAGAHVAIPNLNELYGFSDLRCRNALWTARYLSFAELLGGKVSSYDQTFSPHLSPLIDLASIRYIVSSQPVTCTADAEPEQERFTALAHGPQDVLPGVRLVYLALFTDAENKQANGYLQFDPGGNADAQNLSFVLEVLDRDHNVIWFSDRHPLSADRLPFNVPVPSSVAAGERSADLSLHVRILDNRNGTFLRLAENQESMRLCAIPSGTLCQHQFRLVEEIPGNLRLYENSSALPQAYIAFNEIASTSRQQSLQLLQDPVFNRHGAVVLEDAGPPTVSFDAPISPAAIKRPTTNEVVINFDSPRAGVLVLTDSFFPGWKAYLDGRSVPVLRANYYFRGVRVPAGKHSVVFKYEPVSFTLGLSFLFLFCTLLLVSAVRRTMKRRPTTGS